MPKTHSVKISDHLKNFQRQSKSLLFSYNPIFLLILQALVISAITKPFSNLKFGIWKEHVIHTKMPKTACRNSKQFGFYDLVKYAILGPRTGFFFFFFFSRNLVPPKFDQLPMLRSCSNLVCLFLTTFPRWVISPIFEFRKKKFLPPYEY